MKSAGVQVRRYNPLRVAALARMNNRTHRKLLVVEGNPTAYLEYFERIAAVIPENVTAAALKWLGQGAFTLTVVPGEKSSTAAPIAGRPAAEGKPAPAASHEHQYSVIESAVDRSTAARWTWVRSK